MPVRQLREFLDNNKIKYVNLTHSVAYTAQEIAALTHTKGKELAKTVIVKMDDALAMAVLPASFHVSLESLKSAMRVSRVSLATEGDFRARFPGCETGAMPPFGNLFDMPVFVDRALTKDGEIAFNAGTHHELIRMAYADFERLVQPKVLDFAAGARSHAA